MRCLNKTLNITVSFIESAVFLIMTTWQCSMLQVDTFFSYLFQIANAQYIFAGTSTLLLFLDTKTSRGY